LNGVSSHVGSVTFVGAMRSLDAAFVCEDCGKTYSNMAQHLRSCTGPRLPTPHKQIERCTSPTTVTVEIGRVVLEETMRAQVASDLADLRYGRGLDGPDITKVKEKVGEWEEAANEGRLQRLRALMRADVTDGQITDALKAGLFKGLATAKQEMRYAKLNVPYLHPRVVQYGSSKKESVISFSVKELLARKLQHDKHFRMRCRAKSDKWKRGDNWCIPPTHLRGLDDGIASRYHPHLMRPATDEEIDDLRIMLIFNADDIEVIRLRNRAKPPALPPAG